MKIRPQDYEKYMQDESGDEHENPSDNGIYTVFEERLRKAMGTDELQYVAEDIDLIEDPKLKHKMENMMREKYSDLSKQEDSETFMNFKDDLDRSQTVEQLDNLWGKYEHEFHNENLQGDAFRLYKDKRNELEPPVLEEDDPLKVSLDDSLFRND